ncbi:Cytochrome P [Parasponia andersonii]|uniref:Cytochrome P n=1 Tax=Parasponia andersonii TaxID=3476 RepID=A0A2P5DGB7_PARAD|nr:Cytochrome P [Parasponia andersonii]
MTSISLTNSIGLVSKIISKEILLLSSKERMDPLKLLYLLPRWWQELQKSETLFNQILISLIIIFLSLYVVKLIRGPKLNLPPSPRRLPVIGNLHQLGKATKISKEIMTNSVFQNRPQIKVADAFYYGCTSIAFCPYGEYWRETKKICVVQLLSLKRVQDFQYVREAEVAEMIKKFTNHVVPETML